VLCLIASALDAPPIRRARSQDALTLDPYGKNEGPTHNPMHPFYAPLVDRDTESGSRVPTLAASWQVSRDPAIREFKLRPNVTLHHGDPFNADDVVFLVARVLLDLRSQRHDQLHRQGGKGRR